MKINQYPVLYVHGFRGGDYTTENLVKSALKYNNKEEYLKATINTLGQITYEGKWTKDKYPIVQVVFKNKIIGSNLMARWLSNLVFDLKKIYSFETYHAVGHSLGAVALVLAEMREKKLTYLPKIKNLVLIAGPFNGIIGLGDLPNVNQLGQNGRPAFMSPTYMRMYINRKNISNEMRVLNIYGNLKNYSNSDKYISVTSAKSINYILSPKVMEFVDYPVSGKNAEHSLLHDDSNVLRLINKFVY
ncbi:alpha/beta hydrolase [Lactobacillus terrae]|uniref:alpha/beta hydrolase n=1 Tax=Lactobacillus terrae TaxID=2269374 RepID=UPI000C1B68CE|nr:alpha/beta hydrolase [Lactobacillus terrae]